MANNYINTKDPETPFISRYYVDILNKNSDKAYAYIQTKIENVEVNNWVGREQEWKLIYILTYMVQDTGDFKCIKVFEGKQNFKTNPRVYLTDRIYNISLNSTNEQIIKNELGIQDSKDNNYNFKKVHMNCNTENMCELVYLCMEFWNMNTDYKKIIEMIDICMDPSATNTTTSATNTTTNAKQDANQDGSSNTGSKPPNSSNDSSETSADTTDGGGNQKNKGDGTEMSNVIIRF